MAEGWSYFDEVVGGLIPVQEGGAGARRQPGPGVQPMPEMPQRRLQARPQPAPQAVAPQPVAPPAVAPAKPYSYADDILTPVKPTPAASSDPLAEPDAETWWGRRVQDVRGKQDPRYKGLPALADTGAVNLGDDSVAKLAMPNDEAYGDILSKSMADGVKMTRRFKDANGYEIVGFSGPDGKEQLAYVNQPGLDTSDISRGFVGSLPFMFGGGVAGKALQKVGAPLAGKVLGQTLTGAAVSGAQDIGASQMGSEQGIDMPKMIGGAAGGAIGELAAPVVGGIIRKFWTEPSLYNKATGTLTEKGMQAAKDAGLWAEAGVYDKATGALTAKGLQAARDAGLDPSKMTAEATKAFADQLEKEAATLPQQLQQEFAKLYAKSGNARAAGVAAETGDLGIPTTLGQRTKDVRQLTREQEMRDGVWGDAAAKQMKDFDNRQWDAMVKATMGEIEPGKPGMSMTINPNRSPGDHAPGQIGASIAERSQAGYKVMDDTASATWKSIGKIEPADGALAELPRYIANGLGDLAPSENDIALMPVTTAILKQAKAFMEKSPPKQAVDGFLPTTALADVNRFRQSIGAKIGEMEKSTDKTAAGRVYNAVNDWIREMAEQNLLTATSGDAAVAAANMVTARGLTKNLHAVVEANGNKPGAAIVKKILESADSPEEVVRALFVGPTAKSVKPGSLSAIKSIKEFASQLPKEEGDMLMQDLKLAYWLQIVRNPAGKEGENIFNPQVLLRNLRVSSDSQRSVWLSLFTPQEIAMRNRLTRALENGPTFHDWTIKPNSSRSGTTVGRMFMDMIGGLVGSNYAKTGMEVLNKATGRARANVYNATRQDLPAVNPTMIGPYFSAGGAAGAQSQE